MKKIPFALTYLLKTWGFFQIFTQNLFTTPYPFKQLQGEKLSVGGGKSKSDCLFSPESERKGSTVLDPCNRGKQESERCVCGVVTDIIKQSLPDV